MDYVPLPHHVTTSTPCISNHVRETYIPYRLNTHIDTLGREIEGWTKERIKRKKEEIKDQRSTLASAAVPVI